MSNEANVILHLPLLIAYAVLLCVTLIRCKGQILKERSVPFLICLFIWQGMELLVFFMRSNFWIRYVFTMKYVPLAFLPVSFFYFAVRFYRVGRVVPRWVTRALFLFPVLTSLLILTPYFPVFFSRFEVISSPPFLDVAYGFGFWYYINLVFENLIYIAVAVIVIKMCRDLPKAYRRGSFFHILYLAVLVIVQIVHYVTPFDLGFDVHYYGLSLCGFLFYLANVINSDSSSIDQNSIIDFLDQAVFILNEDGIIVEANRSAVQWLHSLRRKIENIGFDGLLSVLSNNKRILVKPLEDSNDSDIHFIGTAIPLIYRMERRAFTANDGISQGEFITLTDVTRNRLLIDRLRDMAGVDALTGLANRYRYQDLLRKLDRVENYPLAIVIGDVNGLKYVNDTYGHHMGDQYIKDIAKVLADCCPKNGYVARYGGDEFATLLVKSPAEAVEVYIDDVNRALKVTDSVHKPSIAMGYAIKHHGNENLNALIGQADQQMYVDKMARKAAEREALEAASKS